MKRLNDIGGGKDVVYQNGKTIAMSLASSGCITPEENVYSTEETVIGRWIDGKPLYQIVKTYPKIAFASNDSITLEILPSDMNVVSMVVFLKTTNWGDSYSLFDSTLSLSSGAQYSFSIHGKPNRIQLYSVWPNSYPPIMDVTLTLKYTKTTDSAAVQIGSIETVTDSMNFTAVTAN